MTAKSWVRFHLVATAIWMLLAIPTIFFWKESILWIAMMSIWANVAGHFSAYQAARAEENVE